MTKMKRKVRSGVTDTMTIMINTDCRPRRTQITNQMRQTRLQEHIQKYTQKGMKSHCGDTRYCANIQIQSFANENIPDLCHVCAKLICEFKRRAYPDLQSLHHIMAGGCGPSQRHSDNIWLLCHSADSNRGGTLAAKAEP